MKTSASLTKVKSKLTLTALYMYSEKQYFLCLTKVRKRQLLQIYWLSGKYVVVIEVIDDSVQDSD